MTMGISMTFEEFKNRFNNVKRSIDLYVDGDKFNYIDVETDIIYGVRYVTASCGCCSDMENIESDLSYEFSYMSEEDKQELVEQLGNGNNN